MITRLQVERCRWISLTQEMNRASSQLKASPRTPSRVCSCAWIWTARAARNDASLPADAALPGNRQPDERATGQNRDDGGHHALGAWARLHAAILSRLP